MKLAPLFLLPFLLAACSEAPPPAAAPKLVRTLTVGAGGTPILPGCCAWFECRNEMRYPGGDHLIFLGHVESFQREAKPPLIFHGGCYRTLP